MTHPLSPAAQAVWDAAYALPLKNGQPSIVAALCALADQVVPKEPEPDQSAMPFSDWNLKTESWDARMAVRSEILAIAVELVGGR